MMIRWPQIKLALNHQNSITNDSFGSKVKNRGISVAWSDKSSFLLFQSLNSNRRNRSCAKYRVTVRLCYFSVMSLSKWKCRELSWSNITSSDVYHTSERWLARARFARCCVVIYLDRWYFRNVLLRMSDLSEKHSVRARIAEKAAFYWNLCSLVSHRLNGFHRLG